MGVSARLQKTASGIFNVRIPSGQSTPRASPAPSPAIEREGFLLPSEKPLTHGQPSLPVLPRTAPTTPREGSPPAPVLESPNGQPARRARPSTAVENDEKKNRRRTWFGRGKSLEAEETGPAAWVVGHGDKIPYDTGRLVAAERVPELWDEGGDCMVHLYPQSSGKGASFRIDSSLLASSKTLSDMAVPLEFEVARLDLDDPLTPPMTPDSRSVKLRQLFMPVAFKSGDSLSIPTDSAQSEDTEGLIAARNLFAFLAGQSLVATQRHPTMFSIFMTLAEGLKAFGFSNYDGSSFGNVATSTFDRYVDELGLADVSTDREKTIEGIILGERMKNIKLYNEAFTHAAGKLPELLKADSPKLKMISPITMNRLSRASMDLMKRIANVQRELEDFEFPAVFSGTLNSKTADERRIVNFDAWKDSFSTTRKFAIGFYKNRYGSWPPKASKKNDLETTGLNRIVLKDMYHDLCTTYDYLVDRKSLTNRTADGVLIDDRDADAPHVRMLRAVLSEYDRSSPPVKPPVPFDLPILPSLREIRTGKGFGSEKKEAKAMSRKLKDDVAEILTASHNVDVLPNPFLNSFREMERRIAQKCTIKELVEHRIGSWLFMYCTLQALPLLIIDGPGLQHTEGVEYFLCEPPKFGVPWAREDALRNASRTGVAQAGGVAHLPADLLHHGAEGGYLRSHCWLMAAKWGGRDPAVVAALHHHQREDELQDLESPPSLGADASTSRSASLASSANSQQGVGLGLEMPLIPPRSRVGGGARGGSRPVSVYNPNLTFDSILGATPAAEGKKK